MNYMRKNVMDSFTQKPKTHKITERAGKGWGQGVTREKGNVVANYKFGNTRIKVCDNAYRNKSSEDFKAILSRIANRAQEQLSAQANRRK